MKDVKTKQQDRMQKQLTEQHIGALPQNLADITLKQADSKFSKADRDFALDLSGRHPYLIHLVASLLWEYEPESDDETDEMRYETVIHELYDQTAPTFKTRGAPGPVLSYRGHALYPIG